MVIVNVVSGGANIMAGGVIYDVLVPLAYSSGVAPAPAASAVAPPPGVLWLIQSGLLQLVSFCANLTENIF